jgi:ubiquinone biosynthesis protein COQ9
MSDSAGARAARVAQKDRILEAALMDVPFDGWSRQTLAKAARDLGLDPATVRRLFPRGGDDLLAWLEDWADRQMLARLEAQDLGRLKIRERIAAAVRARLEVLAPYREAVRRALAARALPQNAVDGTRAVWRTVDRMWAVADAKRDDGLDYYTKRGLLAGVYSSTLLYWLEDHSEGFEDSWAFLDRRIEDVMSIGELRARVESWLPGGR